MFSEKTFVHYKSFMCPLLEISLLPIYLRQYRIIIVVRLRSQFCQYNASLIGKTRFFVRVYKLSAGGLTPVKQNLCNLTEKMQASVA